MISYLEQLFSLRGKMAVVTGAGRGLGREVAIAMAKRKAYVCCIDVNFPNRIPRSLENNLFNKYCDITDLTSFKSICVEIFDRYNKIDVLINNAGVTYTKKDNELYPQEQWDKTISINLTAAFTCSQIVYEYMFKNKKGSIINITSISAELGFPNNPAYIASKGGGNANKSTCKRLGNKWNKSQ